MRLQKIKAMHYRTLDDIEISFASDYCTISGKNNAGKSCIIRLLVNLLSQQGIRPWLIQEYAFDYADDRTKWIPGDPPIEITMTLCLTRKDDPALISFIEKLAEVEIHDEQVELLVGITITPKEKAKTEVRVGDKPTPEQAAREILTKLRGSDSLFLYNSTRNEEPWYRLGQVAGFYDATLSADEHKTLLEAEQAVQRKTKQLAKQHRNELNSLLGQLSDKYDVEFSTLERSATRRMLLGINLRDKNVAIPLNDWGSGTQNRTFILMLILQANRIKTGKSQEDRVTPIVVIEEPESFLHPSAQAEFGTLLRNLSSELGIQIIVSTHSPYMLNHAHPESNILLRRKIRRKKLQESEVVNTDGAQWMAPFEEHLGIPATEFDSWRQLFAVHRQRVLLVEGETDKEYFEYLRANLGGKFDLPSEVEIVPYGGKDTLKNTMLVKFVLSKFDCVYVTFDLDAADEVKQSLERLGLKESENYAAVGLQKSGRQALEGLLPERVISAVMGRETDLVMQALNATKTSEKNEAKQKLKAAFLEEFKQHDDYTDQELQHLLSLWKLIRKRLA